MTHIQVSRSESILKISIHRPEKQNALTHQMYQDLTEAMASAESDPEIRVIFLTGTPNCFTAGNDLNDFLNKPPRDQESPVFLFLRILSQLKKPLVTAATGSAIGIGTTLMLHSDLVYLGKSAHLKMPFVSLGLCPEAAASYLLPQLLGHQRAAQALMLGESIEANQAVNWGLANAIFTDDTYQTQAYAKAVQLSKQPEESVRLTKAMLKQHQHEPMLKRLVEEAETFVARLSAPEAQAAFMAFLQKRKTQT